MRYQTLQGRDRLRQRKRHLSITGTGLKLYGFVTMLCYSISMTVLQRGVLRMDEHTFETLTQILQNNSGLMAVSGWSVLLQLVGGMAVPVFAFALVEGFLHTGSCKGYLLRLLGCAVISEVPYDFAMSGKFWDLTSQNPLFALAVCLVMLYGLRMFSRKGVPCRIAQLLIVIAAALWSILIRSNFGLCMVMLAAVYYLLYDRKGMRLMLGCIISALYVTGPISTYVLWQYNGEQGKLQDKGKYLFYALYPLHLLVLGGITWLLTR